MEGSELRLLRQRLGLTQATLARSVGVATNTLARWERGELPISSSVSEQLIEIALEGSSGSAIAGRQGVIHDPHHKAILEGLQNRLDPEVFESCAVDLMMRVGFPVAPVSGGKDDGFDGAVADGSGDPFPLVVTTGDHFIRNLSQSLNRVVQRGWGSRKAIFATPRRITPGMRGKLSSEAKEIGFSLVQIFDQDWFANRLYDSPDWCNRLLSVTGRPRALSVFPKTTRPVLGNTVLGRGSDVQWLMSRQHDCLLVGAPGSGKTFLLRSLALQGHAWFLVDQDLTQIASDLRELRPLAVIIDDAHVKLELLETFAQIRREVGAEHVRIIATSWPSEASKVHATLQIGSEDVHELGLIDADTMVEIIKASGVNGPDELLAVIRQQAAGRPGLAATLAHLCLVGDVSRVVRGEALPDQLLPGLDRLLDSDSKRILAPFALAGDAGVSQSTVAQHLGLSQFDVSSKLSRLAASGIVRERPSRTGLARPAPVSVEPAQMRWAMVRDVFFGGAGSLDYTQILGDLEDQHDALMTLMGACSLGAHVPDLIPHLEDAQSPRLWSEYAWLGRRETQHVISHHPGFILDIAQPGLFYVPDDVIPRLLANVVRGADTLGFRSSRPIKEILRWAINSPPPMEIKEAFDRRSALVRATGSWWESSQEHVTAIRVMCLALTSNVDYSATDPGSGMTLNVTYGIHPRQLLERLTEIWPDVLPVICAATEVPWNDLLEVVSAWRYGDPGIVLPSETETVMRRFADRMLMDLAEVTREHPGVQHRLQKEISGLTRDVDLALDPEFESAYPEWKSYTTEEHRRLASDLAERLEGRSIDDLAESLAFIESEASYAGIQGPNSLITAACNRMAADVPDPLAIVDAFIKYHISAGPIEPFLWKAVTEDLPGWTSYVLRCLDDDLYEQLAVAIIIRSPAPPSDLLETAIVKARKKPGIVGDWCSRGQVHDSTLEILLGEADDRVSTSAAIGHWLADPKGSVEERHRRLWRDAILRPIENQEHYYWLGEILSGDGNLARDWLISVFRRSEWRGIRDQRGKTIRKSVQAMNSQQRREVLEALPVDGVAPTHEVVRLLTEEDLDMYRELLKSQEHRAYHLLPLAGEPDQSWCMKAMLAWEAGYSGDDIAGATVIARIVWRGSESKMWGSWRNKFEALSEMDEPIGSIARRGAVIVAEREKAAEELEQHRIVHGS